MASESDMTGTIVSSPTAGDNNAPPLPSPREINCADPLAQPSQSVSSDVARRQRWVDDPRVPACLLSTIVHTIILLILALLTYSGKRKDQGITIEARRGTPSLAVSFQIAKSQQRNSDLKTAATDQNVNIAVKLNQTQTHVPSPVPERIATPTLTEAQIASIARGGKRAAARLRPLPGGGLSGRTPEGRRKYGDLYGATGSSEGSVELALKWIAEHQRGDGSWSFDLELEPCEGRCKNSKDAGDTATPATGATGLALLAFLGAGYTHQSGPYADNVRRGIYYLRSVAGESQFGFDWQQGSMYGHGIALMALSEALSMTTTEDGKYDSDLRQLVVRGADFTDTAQHANGSWGYVPGSPGDTTLTGWQVLSLIAAKRNNVPIRTDTLPRAKDFLRNVVGNDKFEFGYKGPPGEPTTTAIGLTLLLYLGETPGFTPFDRSIDRMAARGPTLTNVYHDYYATLALHHTRHHSWDRWNSKLRDHLVATQSKDGHQRGSWHFKDRWGDIGGRLYTTCMCTMTLEVYYRYLPLYELQEFPL